MNTEEVFESMRAREEQEKTHGSCATPMPQYQCHKKVWALKIKEVHFDQVAAHAEGRETDGTAIIIPENPTFAAFRVDAEYVKKHKPQANGYFVVYDDGYKSWSPGPKFEEGYTRI